MYVFLTFSLGNPNCSTFIIIYNYSYVKRILGGEPFYPSITRLTLIVIHEQPRKYPSCVVLQRQSNWIILSSQVFIYLMAHVIYFYQFSYCF